MTKPRNFWVEVTIDGRKTKLKGGPKSKEGGFQIVIQQRNGWGKLKHSINGVVSTCGKSLGLELKTTKGAATIWTNK